MKYQRLVVIQAGEKTCASEKGRFCTYVRTGSFGTRWHCVLYDEELRSNTENGWLQRTARCKEDFVKPPKVKKRTTMMIEYKVGMYADDAYVNETTITAYDPHEAAIIYAETDALSDTSLYTRKNNKLISNLQKRGARIGVVDPENGDAWIYRVGITDRTDIFSAQLEAED